MHKIIITSSSKFEGSLEFEMDDQEMVRLFKNNAELDSKQQRWFAENFPIPRTCSRIKANGHCVWKVADLEALTFQFSTWFIKCKDF